MKYFFFLHSILFVVTLCNADRISICPAAQTKILPVKVSNIILPSIKLRKGYQLPVKFDLKVNTPLPEKVRVDVYIRRKMFWWIPIPCISTYGSCSYKVDNKNCAAFKIYQIDCKKPQAYKFDHVITVPNINLPSVIVSGLYRVNARIYDDVKNQELLCINAEVNVIT
ncbi:uncharacterized protein LOC130632019 [Hydractinia symbiolongicarpus]|uniref:uncharacterized protein LOC130632019 n=1 Tax=Hydractinia symbiolongicarpus TaxID=13093 RepID=UPI00254B816B|nr:uncharacterized protein LOC130632019 [Hydractinia symbiolongicarpus]